MKKIILVCMICLLMASSALASTYGEANLGYGGGGTICSFTAPNGQEIYYVSAMGDQEPMVEVTDLNFDGRDDLLVPTVMGASNAFYAIYVWDDSAQRYILATNDTGIDTDLPNVWVDAERKLVCARGSNGFAGLLHETYIMRWEGNRLVCLRSAVSDLRETLVQQGRYCLDYSDDGLVYGRVEDRQSGEGTVLWEDSVDYTLSEEAVSAYLEQEETALWMGL